jgi:hypothetical protein
MPMVTSKVNELIKFFTLYGGAWCSLSPRFGDNASKTLASAHGHSASVVVEGWLFAIPTLIPEGTDEAIEEYFTILTDGVVALWERLKEDLPAWAAEYRFPDEATLLETKLRLEREASEIDQHLKEFERLKRVLVLQGEALVDAVMEVFDRVLPLKTRREETFREDLTLIDPAGNAVALAEIKGVSRGLTREHVNQADSHRERNGKPANFPSLLIINTNVKNSISVADKDQNLATEQIQHAARNNILVIRTIDLLNLASLLLSGKLSADIVVKLLTKSCGWLRVGDTPEVLSS